MRDATGHLNFSMNQPIELITKLADQWKDVLQQVYATAAPLDTGKEVEDGLDPETTIRKDR